MQKKDRRRRQWRFESRLKRFSDWLFMSRLSVERFWYRRRKIRNERAPTTNTAAGLISDWRKYQFCNEPVPHARYRYRRGFRLSARICVIWREHERGPRYFGELRNDTYKQRSRATATRRDPESQSLRIICWQRGRIFSGDDEIFWHVFVVD